MVKYFSMGMSFFSRVMTAWISAAVGTRRATPAITAAAGAGAGAAATAAAGAAAALGAAATLGALVVGGVVTLGWATVVGAAVVVVGSGGAGTGSSATWGAMSPAWLAGTASSSTAPALWTLSPGRGTAPELTAKARARFTPTTPPSTRLVSFVFVNMLEISTGSGEYLRKAFAKDLLKRATALCATTGCRSC